MAPKMRSSCIRDPEKFMGATRILTVPAKSTLQELVVRATIAHCPTLCIVILPEPRFSHSEASCIHNARLLTIKGWRKVTLPPAHHTPLRLSAFGTCIWDLRFEDVFENVHQCMMNWNFIDHDVVNSFSDMSLSSRIEHMTHQILDAGGCKQTRKQQRLC